MRKIYDIQIIRNLGLFEMNLFEERKGHIFMQHGKAINCSFLTQVLNKTIIVKHDFYFKRGNSISSRKRGGQI